jgi:hypothetical protein
LSVKTYKPDEVKKLLDLSWLNIDNIFDYAASRSRTHGGFWDGVDEDVPENLINTLLDPDYFYFTVKMILGLELLPFQCVILKELWTKPFPMLIASRGFSKSFLLGVYAVLRCVLCQGSKVVICGAGFRQSKIVFEYCESFWYKSAILRDICGASSSQGPKHDTDRWHMKLGESIIIAIPIGSGDKIRGIRATHLISDEFAAINPEIYENVIQGFAAVSADPVSNVKAESRKDTEKKLGIADNLSLISKMGNQSILSGTTYYTFNHFFAYWRKYKNIIESKGDKNKLKDIFAGDVPDEFNWQDFSVMRMPYNLLPKGFMDIKQVYRSKSMQHVSMFNLEYGAVFSDDSNGFYKRSLIENCVANHTNNIILSSGNIEFSAMLRGSPVKEYIYGIDPASEADNFAIVIIEINNDHRKIVYCWTVTRKLHKQKIVKDPNIERDYYAYCCRKIRELMMVFPCKYIGLDTQGGGIAVEECLHDEDKIKYEIGEKPIWKIIDHDKPDPTDTMAGMHIIHRINFADSEWVSESNHGMRKDMEDKYLLFPEFDNISIGLAAEQDALNNRTYDTLEDCVMEIEELKDELSSIIHSQTGITGRDKWDTPEVKVAGGKKGRLRKDRYTALLIANSIARRLERQINYQFHGSPGGFAANAGKDCSGRLFYGPEDFCQAMQEVYGLD